MEPGMPGKPLLNLGCLMSLVVVQNQMDLQVLWRLAVNLAQKAQELILPMTGQASTNNAAIQNIERGKQRGRAVPLIVVSHRAAAALLHRQTGLSPVQCLNLALLVHAQNQGLLRRAQIQTNNITDLLNEVRVAGQLERLCPIRLQTVLVPHIQDRGRPYRKSLSQSAAAPVSLSLRPPLKRPGDDLCLLIGTQRLSATRTRRVSKQTIGAKAREPRKPQVDCRTARRKAPGYGRLRHSVGYAQDNPGVQHDLLGAIPPPNQPLQKAAITFRNSYWQACGAHTTSYHKDVRM